ncbi:pdz/dhr/glgf [Penicillium mononematosum]|uniref:pdz/dhr/glgf n=1 Tax=Penicillium mononematosum TaxID=268346 RepID=UPI0025472955|nr:pdz/dhr/glgf [Penicillium mononematosum]KAJ6186206.1 pdz/dhr/glgf [Penicillium mononematosum]
MAAAVEGHHGEALGLPLPTAPSTLIESFSPTPMTAILNATIRQREPGTNRWPFEDEMVSAWITDCTDKQWIGPGQEVPLSRITRLWLHGFWGSGRTVVTATVIEHLIRERPANHAVGYYFCSRSRIPTMDPLNILRTLIAQVAQQNEDACKLLEAYLEGDNNLGLAPENSEAYYQGSAASLDMDTLGKLLQTVSQCFERVSLVINSIDFIDSDAEAAFVRLLTSLVDSPASTLRVLFTTSPKSKQERLAAETNCCPIQVKGRAEDIRLFAQAEIAKRISCGDTFLQPDHVRSGIENYIADNSNGA